MNRIDRTREQNLAGRGCVLNSVIHCRERGELVQMTNRKVAIIVGMILLQALRFHSHGDF
jgi:hypothetical protein